MAMSSNKTFDILSALMLGTPHLVEHIFHLAILDESDLISYALTCHTWLDFITNSKVVTPHLEQAINWRRNKVLATLVQDIKECETFQFGKFITYEDHIILRSYDMYNWHFLLVYDLLRPKAPPIKIIDLQYRPQYCCGGEPVFLANNDLYLVTVDGDMDIVRLFSLVSLCNPKEQHVEPLHSFNPEDGLPAFVEQQLLGVRALSVSTSKVATASYGMDSAWYILIYVIEANKLVFSNHLKLANDGHVIYDEYEHFLMSLGKTFVAAFERIIETDSESYLNGISFFECNSSELKKQTVLQPTFKYDLNLMAIDGKMLALANTNYRICKTSLSLSIYIREDETYTEVADIEVPNVEEDFFYQDSEVHALDLATKHGFLCLRLQEHPSSYDNEITVTVVFVWDVKNIKQRKGRSLLPLGKFVFESTSYNFEHQMSIDDSGNVILMEDDKIRRLSPNPTGSSR